MQGAFVIAIVLGALATLGVLIMGLVNMARGRDVTGERSNRLMSYRVLFQLITVLFVVALLAVMRFS